MAQVLVVNPYKKRPKMKRKHRRRRKASFSPKNVARRHARYLVKRRKARATLKTVNPRRRRRKIVAKRRRHVWRRHHQANPFMSELMTIVNPRHKRKKYMAKKRRHHRRTSYLSNPVGGVMNTAKGIVSKENLEAAAGAAVGFVVSTYVMTNLVPVSFKSTHLTAYASKAGVIILTTVAASFVSKRVAKFVLLGGTVSIIMDLYTDYVAPMISGTVATTAKPAGTSMFMGAGKPGVGTFFGHPRSLQAIMESPMNAGSDAY